MRYWILALAAGCGPLGQAPGSPEPPLPAGPPGDPYAEAYTEASDPRSAPPEAGDPLGEPPPDPALAAPRTRSRRTAGMSADAQAFVDAHNRYRARHCAQPLSWSPKLAQVAQNWANTLRDKGCSFGHSGGTFGENLAAGTTGTLDPEEVVRMWYDEVARYKFSGGGFSPDTGHFTQVVWRGTSRIGCGRSQCKGLDIWVCEYDPAGNWEGRYRDNVLPTSCR